MSSALVGYGSRPSPGRQKLFSRRDAPEVLQENLALEIRGRREDRVRAAPAVSCAMCIKNAAHEHTGQRRTPGLPCAMALRLIRVRPGDRLAFHHHLLKLSLSVTLRQHRGV